MPQLTPQQRAIVVKMRFERRKNRKIDVHRFLKRTFPELARVSLSTVSLWYDRISHRQNMATLHLLIRKVARVFPGDFVRERIKALPKIMGAIIEKNGGRTKY